MKGDFNAAWDYIVKLSPELKTLKFSSQNKYNWRKEKERLGTSLKGINIHNYCKKINVWYKP